MSHNRRLELHSIFESILDNKNVYFQPPESLKMKFPCIIYDYNSDDIVYADNLKYLDHKRYNVTLVDKDPDSQLVESLKELDFCSPDRQYASNGLNHFVFTIYY